MARPPVTVGSCGIRVAASSAAEVEIAVAELKELLGPGPFQQLVAFFSVEHAAERLCKALGEAFPGVAYCGCTTAGEITPTGMSHGSIVLIAFPASGFRVLSDVIESIGPLGVERASAIVRRLRAQISAEAANGSSGRVFALMMVDGLSNCEEKLVAAVHWAIDDIPLIGGSAGDGLNFRGTSLIHNGRALSDAAILMIVESEYPFQVFKTQNFEPTPVKLVVTGADTENRIVTELNAEPAAREYASAIGLMPDDLGPFSFASYPLVVRVGGDYYCRSIRNMNADGSLSFFCAIDEGLVFTLARPQDMVRSTQSSLEGVAAALGGVDLVIGFDCVLRRLDAENRQIRRQVEELYQKYKVVGFQTYGEQFNAMHLNQTFTGIAFGAKTSQP